MSADLPAQLKSRLREIATVFLEEHDDFDRLKQAARDLHDLCAGITGIRGDAEQNRADDIHLPSGNAISPQYAAHTIFDLLRTKRFIRGLHDAIHVACKRFNKPVHVLYAGCGPYATLALPLLSILSAQEVRWTLLDIQPDSLDAVRQLIKACEYDDHIADFQLADAATHEHAGPPPHVIVTETMQNLLFNEPQVAITLHLGPRLATGGIFIPEEISVDASIVELAGSPERIDNSDAWEALIAAEESVTAGDEIVLGNLIQLSADFARQFEAKRAGQTLAPVRFALPPYTPGRQLRLQTTIRVFGDTAILPGNSPLCLPRAIPDWPDHPAARQVEFQYQLGRTPGFRVQFNG